jgi:hypothetical protein
MVTRVRIEAHGESAGEVERHINALASAISELVGDGEAVDLGQMVIEREEGEPAGHTAFSGRGLLYLNVASDAPQVRWLTEETGSCSVLNMENPFPSRPYVAPLGVGDVSGGGESLTAGR